MAAVDEKKCGKCKRLLSIGSFCIDRSTRTGYASSCRDCHSLRGSRYRNRNLERVRERNRNYARENAERNNKRWREWIDKPENKERTRLKNQKLWIKNTEKYALRNKKWAAENPDKARVYYKTYRQRNPEKVKQACQKRRARKKDALHIPYTRQQVISLRGNCCGICGLEIDLSVKYPHPMSFSFDHILPLAKGGPDTIENIQPAHYSCNCKKSNRAIVPYLLVANGR